MQNLGLEHSFILTISCLLLYVCLIFTYSLTVTLYIDWDENKFLTLSELGDFLRDLNPPGTCVCI